MKMKKHVFKEKVEKVFRIFSMFFISYLKLLAKGDLGT